MRNGVAGLTMVGVTILLGTLALTFFGVFLSLLVQSNDVCKKLGHTAAQYSFYNRAFYCTTTTTTIGDDSVTKTKRPLNYILYELIEKNAS
jgi:hypothetical protein